MWDSVPASSSVNSSDLPTRLSPAFIRRFRLHAAAQLLKYKTATVSEVAFEVGFGPTDTFSTHVEEQFSCVPPACPEVATYPQA